MITPTKWLAATKRLSATRWLLAAKVLLGVIGLGLLAVGAVKASTASGDAGVIALVIAGALLLVSPFIIDRVERVSVRGGAASLELRFAVDISKLGAPKTAQIVQGTLARFVESYAFIHEELGGDRYHDARVTLQDLLVERSAAIARREKFEASEVRMLFQSGSPMMRVLVLGLMQGDSSLADGATIAGAISDSRSSNEQYHGLQLASRCWRSMSKSAQHAIHGAISSSGIPPEGHRGHLAAEVLALPIS